MKKSSPSITKLNVIAAIGICLLWPATGLPQSYEVRPSCPPKPNCKVNILTFGYNDTNWRRWPCQPRPAESDAKTIGGSLIPTPAPTPEVRLPAAELPSRPALPGGTSGGTSALPTGPTPTTPSVPGGTNFGIPGVPGMNVLPEGLEPEKRKPSAEPKPGASVTPSLTPNELPSPTPTTPKRAADATSPAPITIPGVEPPKSPELPPTPAKPISPPPDTNPTAPLPDSKPDILMPSAPVKGASLAAPEAEGVAGDATNCSPALPMQANWNASLEPERVGENRLRSASYEQRMTTSGNPLRYALQGFCPVELCERDRWVAGNADFQTIYEGQIFQFSSEEALKRFQAAPQKYAPVRGGVDIVLALEASRNVPGSVNHSAVWRGRLYLFSTSASLTAFQLDPGRYVGNNTQSARLRTPDDSL